MRLPRRGQDALEGGAPGAQVDPAGRPKAVRAPKHNPFAPYQRDPNRRFPRFNPDSPKQLSARQRAGKNEYVGVNFRLTPNIIAWYDRRAQILGCSKSGLIQDVLILWANLVQEADREAGIDWNEEPLETVERSETWKDDLLPPGYAYTHLDDAPLGIEEL